MKIDKKGLISVLFEEGCDSPQRPSSDLTEKVIGCAFKVSNVLGCGYLEKVYENAFAYELRKSGFRAIQQPRLNVEYDGIIVGVYEPDIIVEDSLIIEVKALRALEDAHKAQCLNYLKSTGIRLALLINFGVPKIEVKRVAL